MALRGVGTLQPGDALGQFGQFAHQRHCQRRDAVDVGRGKQWPEAFDGRGELCAGEIRHEGRVARRAALRQAGGMTTLGPIAWAAIRIPPGRADAWQRLTGWEARRSRVDDRLAQQLGAPAADGLPLVDLAAAHGRGGVRLIEAEGAVAPLASIGWAAAELSVADLDGVVARAAECGFRLIGAPRALGSNASIRACQLADPGGAVLYCADVRAFGGTAKVHRAELPVDRMFIAVLASADLERSRAWYAERFGLVPTSDHSVPIPVLNDAWGRPAGTAWRISSQQLGGHGLIEIDQYPQEARSPDVDRFGLPGGVIAVAFERQDRADRVETLIGPDGERILLVQPTR